MVRVFDHEREKPRFVGSGWAILESVITMRDVVQPDAENKMTAARCWLDDG